MLCYEIGLKPREVKTLHLKDFNLLLYGYHRRLEQEKNQTRHLMAFILNYSGMGATEHVSAQQIWPLSMDEESEKQFITTMKQAEQLFKEFM